MANILRKAAGNLLDMMLAPAQVVAVRAWQPATLYEIDVHIPRAEMDSWRTIKRVKCKVDELEYRDYTPALWHPADNRCTLFIETGHNGAGSRWAQQLKAGDEIRLGVAHAAPLPAKPGKILCLVDGSALGHALGLKQLTDRDQYPMDVAVCLPEAYQIPAELQACNPDFTFILQPDGESLSALTQWYSTKDLSQYVSIYVAGHIPLVKALRRQLKSTPGVQAMIYGHGFWS